MLDGGTTTTEYAWTSDRISSDEIALLDDRLRSYAVQRAALDAAESFDLARAANLRLNRQYGYSSFHEYMERRLGYAPHTARERLRVARAVAAMPLIANELSRGAITYSHVRELSRVATPDTEDAWLAAIENKTSGEVQELVSGHAYGDLPTDPVRQDLRPRMLRLELRPEVFAAWREVQKAVAADMGREVTDCDVIETLARVYLVPSNDRPAHQLAFKQCPDCKRATMNGAGREIDVPGDVLERAACDARIIGDVDAAHPERATSSVTPRIREQVFARDSHRCCVPGCRSSRNLDVHHIIPQSHGGPHELWNLAVLCSGHHSAHHAGVLGITGRAGALCFRWAFEGAPRGPAEWSTSRPTPRQRSHRPLRPSAPPLDPPREVGAAREPSASSATGEAAKPGSPS